MLHSILCLRDHRDHPAIVATICGDDDITNFVRIAFHVVLLFLPFNSIMFEHDFALSSGNFAGKDARTIEEDIAEAVSRFAGGFLGFRRSGRGVIVYDSINDAIGIVEAFAHR